MTEPLEELWGRFDVDFPNNRSYLTMAMDANETRGKAYLLLLALSGWSVLHRTDGDVPLAVVTELAQRLWPHTGSGLLVQALYHAKLARRTSRGLLLRKQTKWQRTRAEVQAAIESGRRGALKSWASRRVASGVPHQADGVGHGVPRSRTDKEQSKNRTYTAPKGASSLAALASAGLSEYLEAALHGWGAKAAVTLSWRQEEDRLLRLDKRDPDEAQAVLEWATKDDFWRPNIRSLPTFRKQYDALKGQMLRAGSPAKAKPHHLDTWATALLEEKHGT